MTSASALSVKQVSKDISSFAITQTIDKFVSNSIAGSLLKMGTGYLLDWVFDSKEEKEPTVSDAIEKIEHLRETVQQNHEEEMKSLKVINSNIDTKDFRMEADSISDDYKNALMKVNLTNCTIRNAKQESGLRVLPHDSHITLTNCTFENNDSTYDGGAIYTETLNEPLIKDCTFKNNKANNGVGGAIRLFHIDSNNVIKNCKFTNNSGRGANVFVQYGHGLGDKLTKEWGNTGEGMYVVIK